jgi:hypothetical protein
MSISKVASAVTITTQRAVATVQRLEEVALQTLKANLAWEMSLARAKEMTNQQLSLHVTQTLTAISQARISLYQLPPDMVQPRITRLSQPMLEEEIAHTRGRITLRQKQELQQERIFRTRLQRRLSEIESLDPPELSLRAIDQTVLCTLDKYLYELYPIQVNQIAQQMVEACEARTNRIKPLVGYEALQKQLLQLYMPSLMTHPFTLNMMALRLSALTVPKLLHKTVTFYYMGAMQAEGLKTKSLIIPCEARRQETKATASGKTSNEAVPEKFSVAVTTNFTGDEKVGIPKDNKEREVTFMMLRYAFSMPYWLRRMVAIHMGMPENSKYALYFGIGGLPTRRTTWRYDFLKYPEVKYLRFSTDKKIQNLIQKYQSKRLSFYTR